MEEKFETLEEVKEYIKGRLVAIRLDIKELRKDKSMNTCGGGMFLGAHDELVQLLDRFEE